MFLLVSCFCRFLYFFLVMTNLFASLDNTIDECLVCPTSAQWKTMLETRPSHLPDYISHSDYIQMTMMMHPEWDYVGGKQVGDRLRSKAIGDIWIEENGKPHPKFQHHAPSSVILEHQNKILRRFGYTEACLYEILTTEQRSAYERLPATTRRAIWDIDLDAYLKWRFMNGVKSRLKNLRNLDMISRYVPLEERVPVYKSEFHARCLGKNVKAYFETTFKTRKYICLEYTEVCDLTYGSDGEVYVVHCSVENGQVLEHGSPKRVDNVADDSDSSETSDDE